MKTKFYNISADSSIIDVNSVSYNRNRKAIANANWYIWAEENILKNFYHFVPSDIATPRLVHNPKTPLTDILKIDGFPDRGCVISSKFLQLLESFSLPLTKVYPIEILYNDEIHIYNYILFIHDSTVDIDFDKTTFNVRINGESIPSVHISYDKWAIAFKLKERYSVGGIANDSVVFFKDFNYDFFTLYRIFTRSVIVSEKLKVLLDKELFGLKFEICENFIT